MSKHPYQATNPANEPIQQSLFPAWHDRRHSHTSDVILEEGERKKGSFDLLQGIVNEKKKEEDEEERSGNQEENVPAIEVSQETSNKVKSIVKDTTSYIPSIILDNSELSKDNDDSKSTENKGTMNVTSKGEDSAPVRRSRSVRFKEDTTNEDQFVKTSV